MRSSLTDRIVTLEGVRMTSDEVERMLGLTPEQLREMAQEAIDAIDDRIALGITDAGDAEALGVLRAGLRALEADHAPD